MNVNKNSYIFTYATIIVLVVAATLATLYLVLKPYQDANIKTEKQQNILGAANLTVGKSDAEATFNGKIKAYLVNSKGEAKAFEGDKASESEAFKVDMKKLKAQSAESQQLPLFILTADDGSSKYIIPLYGTGLWGAIWGYICLDSDMQTICGAVFDHKSETPGLGAEIAESSFQERFNGKKIFDADENFKTFTIAKQGEKAEEQYKVDGITGGTLTSKGLQNMINSCVALYEPYFKNKKQ
ncbi:MAG: NADH:ubiquinone reductase (Na(+)-transporting) subunit C [Bacteroidales bacterium]